MSKLIETMDIDVACSLVHLSIFGIDIDEPEEPEAPPKEEKEDVPMNDDKVDLSKPNVI